MADLETFRGRFHFNPARAFMVGVERECFITDRAGAIVPHAPMVIRHIRNHGWRSGEQLYATDAGDRLGYELSACQIETRTNPVAITDLLQELHIPDEGLRNSLACLNLRALYQEVAPDNMPLDVYPDPTGRYAQISSAMSRDVLLAACQVAGTHVHIGMPNHEMALKVYNAVIEHCDELCGLGDGSSGRRLAIYRKVAAQRDPLPYRDWNHFLEVASANGFDENPRNCWTLIRISIHGTIEFRMFGTTDSVTQIRDWAARCHQLCMNAHSQ